MSQTTVEWYFVGANGSQQGPHTRESLLSMFSDAKLSATNLVWSPGMENWQPFGIAFKDSLPPPIPSTASPLPVRTAPSAPRQALNQRTVTPPITQPLYFSVSPTKLVVMSICTFGVYQFYWFYKQWNQLRVTGRQIVLPFFRALFAIVTCYSLFARISRDAKSYDLSVRFNPGWLAAAYIVSFMLWRAPYPVWLLGFFSMATLIPAQRAANAVNSHVMPGVNPNHKFSVLNIAFIIIGAILWLPVIIQILSRSHY